MRFPFACAAAREGGTEEQQNYGETSGGSLESPAGPATLSPLDCTRSILLPRETIF